MSPKIFLELKLEPLTWSSGYFESSIFEDSGSSKSNNLFKSSDTKTVVKDKVNLKRSVINIERFMFLNWSLINEFGILVYNSERKIPDSRTTPSTKLHKKTFFLHELK